MARTGLGVAAALLCCVGFVESAPACEGTQVVFEDKFNDDAGGWAINQDVEVKDGSFTFRLPPDAMQSDLNVTYTVDDADICSETVWPDGGSTILGAGLLFWGEDNRNYLQFGVLNNGKFWIARRQDGKWYTIVENVDSSAIKVKPGESNILRVKTSGGVATFFINGTKVRDLRGQAPKGGWRFGLSGDNFDKAKDARVVFKSVKVTD
jgi:3-keto-disaccharide hydrolase